MLSQAFPIGTENSKSFLDFYVNNHYEILLNVIHTLKTKNPCKSHIRFSRTYKNKYAG